MAVLLGPAEGTPPGSAAVDDGVRSATRAELDGRVNRWIGLLRGLGLRTGDAAAVVAGNRVETVEVLLACLHSGVTAVPVNWHLTPAEVAYQLADSGAALVVADVARAPLAAAALALVEGDRPPALVFGAEPVDGLRPAEPVLAAQPDAEPADQVCGALMLYTSGTTGRPKGVINTLFVTGTGFERVERLLAYSGSALGVPADGVVLLVGPWYHSAQLFFSVLPLLRGSRLVMRDRFDAAETLALLGRERVTECHLVPTQFVRLLRLPEAERAAFDGSSLRRVWHGGGPCPVDVKRGMIDWWGRCLVEYYAATEAGVVTMITADEWLERPGSVGRAVPPTEVLILDDDGEPLPAGQPGRVFLRRPSRRNFRYHNAPEKTAAAHLGPGVFTYGELGHVDADGFLYLSGRRQDLILSGGVNVYPAEVEAVLLEHPAVHDVAVVGVPDDEYGERVLAVVEPAATDPPADPDDLARTLDAHCRGRLAGFKVPRLYRLVPELPREPTGKLRRQALQETYRDLAASGGRR